MKIQFLKNHSIFKKGQVIEVPNNEAHTYIDKGVAKIYQHKMMVNDVK